MRGDLAPAVDSRQAGIVPPRARDKQRPLDAELSKQRSELIDPPADDHPSRSLANVTNASAARLGTRPVARTMEICRCRSSPSMRTCATVPAARSASTALREMNVAP